MPVCQNPIEITNPVKTLIPTKVAERNWGRKPLWFGEDGPAIPSHFLSAMEMTARRGEFSAIERISSWTCNADLPENCLRFHASFYLPEDGACVEIRPRSVGFISPRNQASISAR